MSDAVLSTSLDSGNAPVLLVTTTSNDDAAEWMLGLVEKKLAACVTRIPSAYSSFRWQGKVVTEHENLWLIKTTRACSQLASSYVKQHHRYDVPEIAILEISGINQEYHQWLIQNVDVSSESDFNDS